MKTFDLSQSTALISGGLGDLGKACALELAKQGVSIAISDIHNPEHFDALKKELDQLNVQSDYQKVDVTDSSEVHTWIENVDQKLGTPNLVIVNAGIVEMVDFKSLTPEIWKKQLDVNLNGAFYMSHYSAQNLLKMEKPGRIIFIGSWAAHSPHTHIPAYCVSKAGMRSLCQNLALELAPHDILVNEIAPGTVNAGLSGQFFAKHQGAAESSRLKIPNKTLIEPIDVAREVLHLCDPNIKHHVGSTILIDGGNTLRGPIYSQKVD